jgi:hypothetical protein
VAIARVVAAATPSQGAKKIAPVGTTTAALPGYLQCPTLRLIVSLGRSQEIDLGVAVCGQAGSCAGSRGEEARLVIPVEIAKPIALASRAAKAQMMNSTR